MAWTVFKMIQHTTVFYTCIQQYFSQAQCWQPWCWRPARLVATALVELCVEGHWGRQGFANLPLVVAAANKFCKKLNLDTTKLPKLTREKLGYANTSMYPELKGDLLFFSTWHTRASWAWRTHPSTHFIVKCGYMHAFVSVELFMRRYTYMYISCFILCLLFYVKTRARQGISLPDPHGVCGTNH